MDGSEWKSLITLLSEREEIAYKRLKSNSCYVEICERQNQTEKTVEEMYHQRFDKDERIIIRRYYEGETVKYGMEVHEVYIQGLKDCFQLIIRLGLLPN